MVFHCFFPKSLSPFCNFFANFTEKCYKNLSNGVDSTLPWNYIKLSTIQDQSQLSSSIGLEMAKKRVWDVQTNSMKNLVFSDVCIFSLLNLKLITSVHDDEYHPLQNRQLFAASGKKPHIDSSYQFCLVKVLLVTVAFEDGVTFW